MTKSGTRRGTAAAVTFLMIVLGVLAVRSDGFQWGKCILALLLSVCAGIFVALDVKIPKKAGLLVFLLLPFGALCCMECFTHVPWDLTPAITLLNYLF